MTANKKHTQGFTTSERNPANHIAYHILWSRETIPTSRVSLTSTLCTQSLFTPIVGAA